MATKVQIRQRDLLRDLVGDSVDELTSASLQRVLSAIYGAVHRELDKSPGLDQLMLEPCNNGATFAPHSPAVDSGSERTENPSVARDLALPLA